MFSKQLKPLNEWLVRYVPAGYLEATGAVISAVLVGLCIAFVAWLVTGCAGGQVYAKYSHRSSIPDSRDLATSDTVGGCVHVELCKTCGQYGPSMDGCVNWETRDPAVYGRDPSGELAINQPIWNW